VGLTGQKAAFELASRVRARHVRRGEMLPGLRCAHWIGCPQTNEHLRAASQLSHSIQKRACSKHPRGASCSCQDSAVLLTSGWPVIQKLPKLPTNGLLPVLPVQDCPAMSLHGPYRTDPTMDPTVSQGR